MKYVCDACGWEYDEAAGDPENGIAPGTKFEDLPDDFTCPLVRGRKRNVFGCGINPPATFPRQQSHRGGA